MKRIITAMFSLCCLAVLPAAARQVTNIDLDLDKKIIESVKTTAVDNAEISEGNIATDDALNMIKQAQNILLKELESKYYELNDENYRRIYKAFETLIETTGQHTKIAPNQLIFNALDDLAEALDALPSQEKAYYEDIFSSQLFYFYYADKVVNISTLFNKYAKKCYSMVPDTNFSIGNSKMIKTTEFSLTLEDFAKQIKEANKENKESTKVQKEETSSSWFWEWLYWTVKGFQGTK